jgi:Ca2+-binding EF-hand superfamily protein
MDIKEFVEFVKEIRLNVASRGIIELFQKIDTDNSGKIDYNEFVNYFEELTSSKEFESDFNKYAGNKGYMDISNLILFMKEIQKEDDFQIYNAINMILYYNKEIDPKLLKEMQEKLEQ